MTTDLAQQNDDISLLPAQRPTTPEATNQLLLHAQQMSAAKQLADALCGSDLVPAIYKGKPGNGAAAILYGSELGLNPIQSLQQIFVVHGQPAIYARTMVALVKSKGFVVQTVESTDERVTVRAGDPQSGETEESTWTIDRARKAGYTSNKKYESDPQAMLYAKAATEVCRKIAPQVLLGIAFSREELELEQPRYVRNEAPAAGVDALKARMGRLDAPSAPYPHAEPEAEQADDTPPPPIVEPATTAQVQKLNIVLGKEGLDDRAAKLDYLSNQVGREIGSSKELTKAEASELIDFLEKAQAEDASKARS